MKGKFVKKIERELRKLGCDKFERGDTTGWHKPKTYYLRTHYHGHILDTTGDTDLQAYKMALKLIRLEKRKSSSLCIGCGLGRRLYLIKNVTLRAGP